MAENNKRKRKFSFPSLTRGRKIALLILAVMLILILILAVILTMILMRRVTLEEQIILTIMAGITILLMMQQARTTPVRMERTAVILGIVVIAEMLMLG